MARRRDGSPTGTRRRPRAAAATARRAPRARRAASGSSKVSGAINGAGSTFAAPDLPAVGLEPEGSGHHAQLPGRSAPAPASRQLAAGHGRLRRLATRRWAPTRSPPRQEGSAPIQIPIAFGAITVSYNLSGVKAGLKLDGKTIADIYLGKVKKWNDPEIAAQNSGTTLPDKTITVVHRSDSSGTTKGFTAVPGQLQPRVEERPRRRQGRSSGRRAPAPRATTASPRPSSRPTAPSATSSRPTRCRTTSPSQR